MIYTGPLFYEEHEQPYDFFRYTQFGVRHLMQGAGFEIERLDWLEGYLGTAAYQLDRMSRYLPTAPSDLSPGAWGCVLAPVLYTSKLLFRPLASLFHWMDTRHKYRGAGFPKNYVAICIKPARHE